MLSKTSLASRDFFTMTSFSRTAVCMRRTLDWFLSGGGGGVKGEAEGRKARELDPVPSQPQAHWAAPNRLNPRPLQTGLFTETPKARTTN